MNDDKEKLYQERLARYVVAMDNGLPDRVPIRWIARVPHCTRIINRSHVARAHEVIHHLLIVHDVSFLQRSEIGRGLGHSCQVHSTINRRKRKARPRFDTPGYARV